MRFHLIDRIDEIKYGSYIKGTKCITLADDVFNEHFPAYPIFPGTLILEGMAQLGGSFFEMIMDRDGIKNRRAVLMMVNRMKFIKPSVPGDKLIYTAELKSMQDDFGVVAVKAENEGEVVAKGEITFSFITIESDLLQESRQTLYDICMKNCKEVE